MSVVGPRIGWDDLGMRYMLPATCAALLTMLLANGPAATMETPADEYPWVDELPNATHKMDPIYPCLALAAKVDGEVLVQVRIGEDGKVQDARLIKSIPMLDAAAMAAAEQWTFTPARDPKGKPVAVWAAIPFTFRLPSPQDTVSLFCRSQDELAYFITKTNPSAPQPPSERDEALRARVIQLGLRVSSSLPVPRTCTELVQKATSQLDASIANVQPALDMLSIALYRAPWFAEAYLQVGRALEAAGRPRDAAASLRLYLLADPNSGRTDEVEGKLKALESATKH